MSNKLENLFCWDGGHSQMEGFCRDCGKRTPPHPLELAEAGYSYIGLVEDGKDSPYITTSKISLDRVYNPVYGDDRECVCGDPYYRHFDTYEDMYPCGCKYCSCSTFVEANADTLAVALRMAIARKDELNDQYFLEPQLNGVTEIEIPEYVTYEINQLHETMLELVPRLAAAQEK